jgi:hypothetical protein
MSGLGGRRVVGTLAAASGSGDMEGEGGTYAMLAFSSLFVVISWVGTA